MAFWDGELDVASRFSFPLAIKSSSRSTSSLALGPTSNARMPDTLAQLLGTHDLVPNLLKLKESYKQHMHVIAS